MVFGFYINYKVIEFKTSGKSCDVSLDVGLAAFVLYTLMLILFVNFFARSYILRHSDISTLTFTKFRINSIVFQTYKNKTNKKEV